MTTAAPAVLPNSIVQHLRSSRAGARPGDGTLRSLLDGEIFINQADGVFCTLAANGATLTFGTLAAAQAAAATAIGAAIAPLAPLASPALTGSPTAPTPAVTVADTTIATMAAMRNVLTYVTPEMFGAVGDGSTNDRAAFVAAFAFLSTAGTKLMRLTRMAYAIAGVGQLVVPTLVTVASDYPYAGGDGANQPQLLFSDPTAGVYLSNYCSLRGVRVTTSGGNTTVPNIEYCGEIGIYNVRTDGGGAIGIAATRVLGPLSATDLYPYNGPTSGMTNGTYAGVAFTAGGVGVSATINVTVANGTVSAVSFATFGTVPNPSFIVGIAANALYSGSPAITSLCFAITAQSGRSRFGDIWAVGHTTMGVEIDNAEDFVNGYNIHVWNPVAACAKALRVGKSDGLTLTGFKCYNATVGQSWENVYPAISFATVEGTELDLMNTGISITGAMQVDFKGGYVRSVGPCFSIVAPLVQIGINMNLLSVSAHNIVANAWGSLAVAGCNFVRSGVLSNGYSVYLSNTGGGACNVAIGDNNTDGNGNFCYMAGAISGTLGKNNWWPTFSGGIYLNYLNSSVTTINVAPVRGGQFNGTTDANGRIAIPHTLGNSPPLPRADTIAATTAGGYRAGIVGLDATNITCQILTAAGAMAGAGVAASVLWEG